VDLTYMGHGQAAQATIKPTEQSESVVVDTVLFDLATKLAAARMRISRYTAEELQLEIGINVKLDILRYQLEYAHAAYLERLKEVSISSFEPGSPVVQKR
jgi:hypothetical protein